MINKLLRALGGEIHNPALFVTALTHRSYANESATPVEHNDRLEFLGDAVVGLVVGEELCRRLPALEVGELAKLKALVVSEETLARAAARYDLGAYLSLGRGEKLSGGAARRSIMADTFEAVTAALYLDGGYGRAKEFVLAALEESIAAAATGTLKRDYKSVLQVHTQQENGKRPSYHLDGMGGPAHQPVYRVAVFVNGRKLGVGEGTTKKAAEQEAARAAGEKLGLS